MEHDCGAAAVPNESPSFSFMFTARLSKRDLAMQSRNTSTGQEGGCFCLLRLKVVYCQYVCQHGEATK